MTRTRTMAAFSAIFAVAVTWAGAAHALLMDVTQPGDSIQIVNGTNDGDAFDGSPPPAEDVENAINDVGQKYLNFLDLNSGFVVSPTLGASEGGTVLGGLRLYTANDAEPRDPASYLLEGATGVGGPWTLISSGDLSLPSGRNDGFIPVGSLTNFQEILFGNTVAYLSYRLTFPTLKDAANANSMQIAEVELLGEVANSVPEPGTLALLGLGIAGAAYRRRRMQQG